MHYDLGSNTVLAWCDCGWRELSRSKELARELAIEHERTVHPDSMVVRQAAWLRERRRDRRVDP
jgi:hypothetical protein